MLTEIFQINIKTNNCHFGLQGSSFRSRSELGESLEINKMSFSSLNAEYVDPKSIERLCAAVREENENASNELASITSTSDLKQIKEVLRNTHWNIDHPIRRDLWVTLCDKLCPDSHVDLYRVLEKDLFGDSNYRPNSLPAFLDPAYCIRYHLNAEGRKCVEKILHILYSVKPDITYCAILYPLVSLFLHYMPEEMVFSCTLKLLQDKQQYISQTKSDHMTCAFAVMKLAKKYAHNAYVQLEKELKEHEDLENMFQNWLSWIFKGLPFPYLVRVMDCFLVEKKKCLFRMVLALLMLYSKHADKSANEDLGMIQKLLDYFQNITMPAEKVFKVAYGIRGFSEKVVNQQFLKAQMMMKSHSNLGERCASADGLSPTNPIFTLGVNSADQPIGRELRMDASSRTRSVGIVALGHFKSEIITAEQMSLIWSWLPIRITMLQPEVIYSTNKHGVCLTAFYMAVGPLEPTVLIVKSSNDEVFGAYCPSSWDSRNKSDCNNKKYTYFGTGESFLFTLVPQPRKYPWIATCTSENIPHSAKLFMAADNTMITVGAGNGQGLVLYDQLLHGRTEHCDTFNNEPLCSMKDFQCKIVEVVAFN